MCVFRGSLPAAGISSSAELLHPHIVQELNKELPNLRKSQGNTRRQLISPRPPGNWSTSTTKLLSNFFSTPVFASCYLNSCIFLLLCSLLLLGLVPTFIIFALEML